jgi:hypothetical protein
VADPSAVVMVIAPVLRTPARLPSLLCQNPL